MQSTSSWRKRVYKENQGPAETISGWVTQVYLTGRACFLSWARRTEGCNLSGAEPKATITTNTNWTGIRENPKYWLMLDEQMLSRHATSKHSRTHRRVTHLKELKVEQEVAKPPIQQLLKNCRLHDPKIALYTMKWKQATFYHNTW